MSSNTMQYETTDTELKFTRLFNAPRDLVFQAFSSCEHLKNWWGPKTWPMAECSMDFRPGGVWHYCLRGPKEEDQSWGLATYEQIDEPERIVYTDGFSDEEGNLNTEFPQAQVTMEFAGVGGKTRLTGRSRYPTADDLQTVLEMGAMEGMTETIDRLEEYLDTIGRS